jgi:hypothetical protein
MLISQFITRLTPHLSAGGQTADHDEEIEATAKVAAHHRVDGKCNSSSQHQVCSWYKHSRRDSRSSPSLPFALFGLVAFGGCTARSGASHPTTSSVGFVWCLFIHLFVASYLSPLPSHFLLHPPPLQTTTHRSLRSGCTDATGCTRLGYRRSRRSADSAREVSSPSRRLARNPPALCP